MRSLNRSSYKVLVVKMTINPEMPMTNNFQSNSLTSHFSARFTTASANNILKVTNTMKIRSVFMPIT